MTTLKDRLKRLIVASGPIPVSEYMAACLFDPETGYYTTREPFGAAGDFTTAPEISQMFGELVAAWCFAAWQALGRPDPFVFAEFGPGRGTMMHDMLRALAHFGPDFAAAARVVMIEASPRLAELQHQKLASRPERIQWVDGLGRLPALPLVVVGNELFDAIPTRQFIRAGNAWRERMVALDETGELAFRAGAGAIDPALLPHGHADAPDGAIFEYAPARVHLMEHLCAHVATHSGAGLFIDYGHLEPGIGDTLQAVRQHEYDDVLANPGEADITSHVDFHSLAEAARAAGLEARLATQGAFLLAMGLLERAGALGANADTQARERITADVERLAGPSGMGDLFKAIAVAPQGVRLPPLSDAH